MTVEALMVIVAAIGIGACSIFVLNARWLTKYFHAAATDEALAKESKVPLILSVAGCILGPAVLILAPIAIFMAFIQEKRIERSELPRVALVLPRLAVINAFFVMASCVLLIGWAIGFVIHDHSNFVAQ